MKEKYRGWICCLIAIIILFSGMCMEQPNADSLFACVERHAYDTVISSSADALSFYELSTTEFQGVRTSSFLSAYVKTSTSRTFLRLALLLYMAGFFLFRLSNLQAAIEQGDTSETFYFAVLLNYIQSKDGKK